MGLLLSQVLYWHWLKLNGCPSLFSALVPQPHTNIHTHTLFCYQKQQGQHGNFTDFSVCHNFDMSEI